MSKYDNLRDKYPWFFGERCSIQCDEGWYDIIDDLMNKITEYQIENDIEIKVVQIKEKFGCLRFYESSNIPLNKYGEIRDMIRDAEEKSARTCECCGTVRNIGRTSGWIRTVCKKCFLKVTKGSREWTPILSIREQRKQKIDKIYQK